MVEVVIGKGETTPTSNLSSSSLLLSSVDGGGGGGGGVVEPSGYGVASGERQMVLQNFYKKLLFFLSRRYSFKTHQSKCRTTSAD